MSKGLSNYQIDDFFKDKDNEELRKITWEHIQVIQ